VLFVCFGCPKQEKWIAMHYRSLGVPLAAGVGGTMDFLAGTLKRAPVWMRRSGTEWLFRLLQEPRRLFRRYTKDLWVFSTRLAFQWWKLHFGLSHARNASDQTPPPRVSNDSFYQNDGCALFICPERLDHETVSNQPVTQAWLALNTETGFVKRHVLLDMSGVSFIDSTGIGLLVRLQKQAHANKKHLVLLDPSAAVQRALSMLHLGDFFPKARNASAARHLLRHLEHEHSVPRLHSSATTLEPLAWQGEITAANAAAVWNSTRSRLAAVTPPHPWRIDLSAVRFIDSSGLGLMLRLKKFALEQQRTLSFLTPSPPVLNVLRLSNLDKHLLQP
jgi:N-acetylglucosaminyldiphosphoundecaprenol N-acetyl-beta-D-mannosaminyltransferase